MTRTSTRTAARRQVRPVRLASPPLLHRISEDDFHRARESATALTNTSAGETFQTAHVVYVRVNGSHFRIEGEVPLSHAEALACVGRSAIWRQDGGDR